MVFVSSCSFDNREVPKAAFVEKTNNHIEPEPFVHCSTCGRKFHEICVLWNKCVGRPFVCKQCRGGKDVPLLSATSTSPHVKLLLLVFFFLVKIICGNNPHFVENPYLSLVSHHLTMLRARTHAFG